MNSVNSLKTRITRIEQHIEEQERGERAKSVCAIVGSSELAKFTTEEEREAFLNERAEQLREVYGEGPGPLMIIVQDRKSFTPEDLAKEV